MRTTDFCEFIRARELHRITKDTGWEHVKDASPDPIIAKYRFCNVRRNDDRVTKHIMDTIVEPWAGKKKLWFALVVARLFNNEPALDEIGPYILPFKPKKMRKALHERAKVGLKNFNAAYIVSTNGRKMDKVDYVIDIVLTPLWERRKELTRAIYDTNRLEDVHKVLVAEQGLGSFMAAQVIADLKYADPILWDDFDTFAASGPGSKRGLNRVMGFPIEKGIKEPDFRRTLSVLRDAVNSHLSGVMFPITAQDIQNCLCEFDKYERVRLGEGKPKQKYAPLEK